MTNNISFKAQFIKPVYIKRVIDKDNSKCLASFIELNQANINDVKTIELLNKEWGDKAKYLKNIYSSICNNFKTKIESPDSKIYALTTQISDLENLNPSSIQGVVEVIPTPSKDLFISFIQANPENMHKSKDRVYSKIGTEIIETLKKLFPRKKLTTISGNNSQSFYEKNNFIENHCGLLEYIQKND